MVIKNANIVYPDRIEPGAIRIEDGRIAEVNPANLNDGTVIEAEGLYLSPGFIDVHIHGAAGRDTMEGTVEAISGMARAMAKHGTTAFLPTTMTMDIPTIQKAIAAAVQAKTDGTGGAQVLGVHLEGPFVNKGLLGAQNPRYVLQPSVEAMREMMAGFEDEVIAVTLAPELPGSEALIRYLDGLGIKVAMGHTNADYETARAAIGFGVSHATHLYNAMSPFNHRAPGVVGAVFDSDITTEFIADGIHITYTALRIALRQKGTDKILLVTDAMMGCTMPDGRHFLGGQEVFLSGGAPRLKDGTFAGTLLTLDTAIRNLKNNTQYPLYELVKMATCNPAAHCGVEKSKGQIKAGYDADVILFDEDIAIQKVMVGGRFLAMD